MTAFSTTGPITVVFDVSAGNIHLSSGDRAEAVVEVLPTDASRKTDVATAEQTKVEFADGIMRITTPRQPPLATKTRSVDITIQVPTDSSVRGKAAVGRFRAEGRLAACQFTLAAGDITVDRAGSVTLRTSMGKVLVGQVDASASIEVSDGNVRIAEVVRGSVDIATQRGHIDVGVSEDAAVQLITKTMDGSVSNGLNANPDGRRTTEIVTMDVRTISGDIAVHRSTENTSPVGV